MINHGSYQVSEQNKLVCEQNTVYKEFKFNGKIKAGQIATSIFDGLSTITGLD